MKNLITFLIIAIGIICSIPIMFFLILCLLWHWNDIGAGETVIKSIVNAVKNIEI